MKTRFLKSLKDSFLATLPVLVVVLVLFFTRLINFTVPELIVFLISSVLVILGMCLFNVGAETSMSKMGELVGSSLTKQRKMGLLVVIFFLFGLFITIAEPDLSVLADQVPINSGVLIVSIGVGVGIFLVIGALRILFQKSLKVWLLAFYGLMFALCCLIDSINIPLSMDSGGVTTGPITVPFILAVGVGIATARSSRKTSSDSFGLVAFCSIGPILTVMILSLIMKAQGTMPSYEFVRKVIQEPYYTAFTESLFFESVNHLGTLVQVLISIAPIVVFFIIYNAIFLKLSLQKTFHTMSGVIYVYIGLVLFMTAIEAGFLPIGQKLGVEIAGLENINPYLVLVFIGAALGVAAVFAEPAVHVLTNQIESVSDGTVKKSSVLIALAVGNGLAIAISMLRIIFKIPLVYIIVPGYFIAFALTFFVPDIYSAIAFDSGGVVSGPMNTTFIMPYAIGACFILNCQGTASSNDILLYALGTVALVALSPLISIQLLGLRATFKQRALYASARNMVREEHDDQIIHF